MSTVRERAISEAHTHNAERFYIENRPVSEYFGVNVLDMEKISGYISKEAFECLVSAIKGSTKLSRDVADEIAEGMKTWAMEKGATHYTHLFQPLTDATAEKHEAFISTKNGKPFEKFSGSTLVQQEPDASSFPNGGLRNTFEARGYSAWDPSSPVFVMDGTLLIPSVFVSYTGEALDYKIPNLKSLQAINNAAVKLARMFDDNVSEVNVNLGLEQEYFLVDEALYNARPDLALCGRTVIGHTAAKDQQLGDHYFGAIPSRASAFMKDFETEAYKLGILLKTRHNEAAPNQFECAPLYCGATKAIDQNMMLMILMQKVSEKHHLKVIFHEKPFDGVNGSGKHINWSIVTDTGKNLLSPGSTPITNLSFLSFFAAVIRGVYKHNFLLMSSVASLNNSYRLGGNEAPPSVMSIFSGRNLYGLYRRIVDQTNDSTDATELESINITDAIPEILLDNTDRNRTSPFAFTGNRFEFRALGASQNAGSATYVINAIVAESLNDFYDGVMLLMEQGMDKSKAVLKMVRNFFTEAEPVMFEGNGYSKEWEEEASARGLKAINNVPEAFTSLLSDSTEKLFRDLGIMSSAELKARFEVQNETYVKKLQIEARILGDICLNHVIPSAIRYQNLLIKNLRGLKDLLPDYEEKCSEEINALRVITSCIEEISKGVTLLVTKRSEANRIERLANRAEIYSKDVFDMMKSIRKCADKLEMIVDDELWPIPKYRELLFF